ncbi:MAG: MFS transporter [Planctomycetes bacterium]|nr:MFS transporter [Planctomycetota bacterium]
MDGTSEPATAVRLRDGGVSPQERDRSLRVSVIDGCFHGGMVGFGENYVGAYAVFLGATPAIAAALGSWPSLAGAIFGAFAVDLVDRSRRRALITVSTAGLAGLMFFALLGLPLAVPRWGVYTVIAAWLVYVAANNVAGPAWNSWMGDLVPSEKRGAYFGRRSGLIAVVTLVCTVAAGLLLDGFKKAGRERDGWIAILALAAVFKLLSVWFLSRMAEPRYEPRPADYFTFRQFLARSPGSNFAWFTYGIALMYFCVHLSGPFFALYQLKTLNWSYNQFMASTATQILSFFLTQHWWGKVGDRRGSRLVLLTSGVLCALLPLLWCVTTNFWALLAVQILAGFCWGGFNLATSNFLFEAVTPAKRARCAAYFNVVTAVGIFAGAATGAVLVGLVPARWGLASPFLAVFALSGILRFPVVLLWLRGVQDGAKAHEELRERARQLRVVVKGDPGDAE